MSSQSFQGKKALISGAGSGIGLELAKAFGRQGAVIIGTDINENRVQEMVATLKAMGVSATGYTVNHADPADVEALSKRVLEENGPIDILCCNAGVGHGKAFEQTFLEDWKWVMDINLYGAVYLVHYFLPSMIERKHGHILLTASGAGLFPIAGMAPYCMSKSAMVVLANVLRMELKMHNINVSALCPGIINTQIIKDGRMGNEKGQAAAEKFYAKQGVSPAVVARSAVNGVSRNKALIQTPVYHVAGMYLMYRLLPNLLLWIGSLLRKRGWSFLGPFLKA